MNENIIKKMSLSVDSIFRQEYNNTSSCNFVHILPSPIKNVISMKITAIEIPNFWYAFSSKNRSNEFTITTNNFYQMNNTKTDTIFYAEKKNTIVIPQGNYYDIDLPNLLNAYFLNENNGLQYLIFEINPNTGCSSFRARNPEDDTVYPSAYDPNTPYYSPTFHYSIDFRLQDNLERPLYLNMGWRLGFKKAQYIISYQSKSVNAFILSPTGNLTYHTYLQSEAAFGNGIFNYLFLDIDDFNKNFTNDSIRACLEDSYLEGNNILARVTITTGSNAINLTNGADAIFKMRKYFGPVTIDTFHIRLLDKFGSIMDLNDNDFSFLLEMEIANE